LNEKLQKQKEEIKEKRQSGETKENILALRETIFGLKEQQRSLSVQIQATRNRVGKLRSIALTKTEVK